MSHDPELIAIVKGFLDCPEIAECAAEDKDPETDALERRARAVLDEAARPAPGGPKTREGWQPIETAPKDGRDFLVWNRENRVRKARWYERSSSDLGISLYEGDGVNSFKGGIQPTHWMPLPAPPEPTVPEVPARVDGEGK